jgi:tetratricopeptide (TPR) repeat protein
VEQRPQRRRREESTLETILSYWWLPLPLFGAAIVFRGMWGGRAEPAPAPAANVAPAVATPNAEVSALVQRAHAIFDRGDLTRENLRTAEELCDRAIALDAMSAEAWGARAQVHAWFSFYNYDRTEARRARAKADAARAMNLAPQAYEVRLAHAAVLVKTMPMPAARSEAEEVLRALAKERADDVRVFDHLGLVLREQGRMEEAAQFFLQAKNPGGAAWTYTAAGDYPRAMEAVELALTRDSGVSNLTLKAILEYRWREDLDAAQAAIDRLPGSAMLDESFAMNAVWIALFRRESEKALRIVRSLPGDYLSALGFSGPKAALLAFAHEIAGRTEAAKAEWRAAMATIEEKLQESPNDSHLLWWKTSALAGLGEADAAAAQFKLALELAGVTADYVGEEVAGVLIRLGHGERVMDWLEKQLAEKQPRWERLHSGARFHRDYDPLRGNERFERLLRDNLPAGAKPM